MHWIKLHTGIHRNPKVRRAGPAARELYVFLLCLNGEHDFGGVIPPAYLDPEFLAYELQTDPVTARDALVTLRDARLVTRDASDGLLISGWGDDWAPPPKTGAERMRQLRARRGVTAKPATSQGSDARVTESDARVTRCDGVTLKRGEEKRGEEKRREIPEKGNSAGGEVLVLIPPDPPAVQRAKRETPLGRWQVACARLWALQEDLRAEAIPGARPLKATDERLGRIASRLDAGASEDDCVHVLRVYAADARRDPERNAEWFNGATPWIQKNFERALGRPIPSGSAPARPAMRPAANGDLGTEGLRALAQELRNRGL